ncbi:hypothetical protein [Tianweitania sediminis]|uniref:Dynamin n=1 Tax=Tianweitania sediminis TaxID=1502156 RepID=A0A8J7UIG5_9HYPH|nr:hypothetical protein [Tianweitania sediminis]MBP0437790.1 hypothetical protein [Tianweitania sediminis]
MALPPNHDPLSPNRTTTDPASPDPVVTPGSTYNQTNVSPGRSGSGNGILIGAVVVVLAIVAYFVFVPNNTPGTDAEPTAATTSVTPAPIADEPAAPAAAPADAPAPVDSAAPAAAPAPAGGETPPGTVPATGTAPAANQ